MINPGTSTPVLAAEESNANVTVRRRAGLAALLGVLLTAGAGAGLGRLWFGSFQAALAWLDGRVLHVERIEWSPISDTVDQVQFHVQNLTSDPVRIVGEQSSCRCVRTASLPVEVPPVGGAVLRFQVDRKSGSASEEVILFTSPAGTRLVLPIRKPPVPE